MSGRFKPPSEEDKASFTKSLECKTIKRKTASDVQIFELYLREALNENRQLENLLEEKLAMSLLSYIDTDHLLRHDLNLTNKSKFQSSEDLLFRS